VALLPSCTSWGSIRAVGAVAADSFGATANACVSRSKVADRSEFQGIVMSTTTLQALHVGPIKRADVRFGDLTVLVGPQATGKSIFLQLLKLLVDTGAVLDHLKRYGLEWRKDTRRFLDIYLGEGMSGVWRENRSRITFQGEVTDLEKLVGRQKPNKEESLFYIPAQRVLTLGNGWPRPFTDYGAGDPFAVRDFSEKIRVLMDSEIGAEGFLFPQTRRLKREIRQLLSKTVFAGFRLRVDKHGLQRRLVLEWPRKPLDKALDIAPDFLPFMVWSAGQREFVPLLLGLYYLLPPTKVSRRDDIKWVVIEELETGLHPKAISVVLLLVLNLLSRGYCVCLSTHSPHVLDVVWALNVFKEHRGDPRTLLKLFDVEATQTMRSMAEKVLRKDARVYYFDQASGETSDISRLYPGADEAAEAGWGGLTEFSGRVADSVAEVVGGSEG
jgi:hypothetical protein